jgi:hypothetical protein
LAEGISSAFLIDRIDAVVNGRVITKNEVDKAFEAEVLRLEAQGKKPAPSLRKEVLDSLINRILVLDEARKFNLVQVTDGDVEKAFDSVKQGFPSEEAFLSALTKEGMTPAELKGNLRDQILAAKYIDRRIKSFVRVTLQDQKKYYDENRDKFGNKSFNEVQEEINGLLTEKETGGKLDDYLNELRAKSSIQLMGPE